MEACRLLVVGGESRQECVIQGRRKWRCFTESVFLPYKHRVYTSVRLQIAHIIKAAVGEIPGCNISCR